MKKLILALTLIAGMANAAVWERPAGGYTPTNHSVNTTKYQTDRSNNVAISSVKVDGDINKAFEGLNNLETRSAPSVVGQAGKFLGNNGANTFWGLISPTSINSGASASGHVLKSDGSGTSAFGLLDTTSFPDNGTAGTFVAPTITFNSAGFATAVTETRSVSLTSINVSGTVAVTGTINVSGTVSATEIAGPAARSVSRAWVNFRGDGSTGVSATVTSSYNVSGVYKNGTGDYTIYFTKPMNDANYVVSGVGGGTINNGLLSLTYGINTNYTTASARIRTGSNAGFFDSQFTHVLFFGN